MDWWVVLNWVYARRWPISCIVAPILLGFGASVLTASMLMHQDPPVKLPPYEFLSTTGLPRAESMAEIKQLDENLAMTFVAKDLRGRTSYAVASAFLYLASAAAIGFGFWVVRPRIGAQLALVALLASAVAGYIVASHPNAFDLLRPMVVERILEAAKNQAAPMNFLASGDADRSWFNRFVAGLFPGVGQFGDPAVTGLLRLNSLIGLIAVGMLLAALASISVRREKAPTHEELVSRLMIMRIVLALGAAVLVIAVLCSKILIDWPTSLLSHAQQKAIAPIGEALNLMFGASCTMALIAALGPALVAFVLDRQVYRAALADTRQAEAAGVAAQDRAPANAVPAQQFADDLGFAVWPSISAAIAVFSPLLAPLLAELVKSIFKISQS